MRLSAAFITWGADLASPRRLPPAVIAPALTMRSAPRERCVDPTAHPRIGRMNIPRRCRGRSRGGVTFDDGPLPPTAISPGNFCIPQCVTATSLPSANGQKLSRRASASKRRGMRRPNTPRISDGASKVALSRECPARKRRRNRVGLTAAIGRLWGQPRFFGRGLRRYPG